MRVNLAIGSAKAIIKIFPELEGKLDGIAIRVPMLNSSITDLTMELEQDVTIESVNQALKEFSAEVPDILGRFCKTAIQNTSIKALLPLRI